MMTNYSENDLAIPSLKIIENSKNGIDTQNLINKLREALKPNGEDILILTNRSDDRFSQKVRNLRSHKTLEKKNWVKFRNNKYFITDEGLYYLRQKNYIDFEKKDTIFNLIPLKYFNFSERINSFLNSNNYKFVYDLNLITNFGNTIDKLTIYPNMGKKSVDEIKNFYIKYSLFLDNDKRIEFDDPTSLYYENEESIRRFVIENIENEGNSDQVNILSSELITIFLKKTFSKNYKTIEKIYNERILNNTTLQSVADKFNVTRERIRQIEKKIKSKLKDNLTLKNSLYKIDLLIKKIVIENENDFYQKLINKKIIDKSLSISNILSLLSIFEFRSVKKFKKINKKYFAFETNYLEKELKKNINNFITKSSRENGIINLDILHRNLLSQNFNLTKKILFDLIDEKIINSSLLISDNLLLTNVLKKTKKSTNVLVGVINSTLSVTSKIDLNELILCIKQFRRLHNYSPEPGVLIKICQFLNYKVEDSFIINENYSVNNLYLKGVRKNLFKMFLDNERIMTYEEILDNYEKYYLNINSVNVMLYENLFIMPRKGIYVLAGSNIEEYILDRLDKKRQQDLKKLSDNTSWKYNKSLNIVFSCNKMVLLKGKIYMPNNFAAELPEGEYTIKLQNNISSLKVYASQLWFDGPSKVFFKKYMKKNVQLEFDTIKKIIQINSTD